MTEPSTTLTPEEIADLRELVDYGAELGGDEARSLLDRIEAQDAEIARLLEALAQEREEHRFHICAIPMGANYVPQWKLDEKWPSLRARQALAGGGA